MDIIKQLIVLIPSSLRDEFKIKCIKKGVPMRTVLLRYIEKFCSKNTKGAKK